MSFRKKFTVKRKSAGTFLDGVFTEGATQDIDIYASAQPVKPEDVQQFDFGRRNSKYMTLTTNTKLYVVRQATDTTSAINPDVVVIDGEEFNVDKEEVWQNGIIPHYRYLVVKVIED